MRFLFSTTFCNSYGQYTCAADTDKMDVLNFQLDKMDVLYVQLDKVDVPNVLGDVLLFVPDNIDVRAHVL